MKKFKTEKDVVDTLKTILVNSGLQGKDPALFQTTMGLIENSQLANNTLKDKLGKDDKIDLSTQSNKMLPLANGGGRTGLYIPELTLVANLLGAGSDPTIWFRLGDYIHVSGMLQVSPNAFNVTTQLGFSLPVLSYFDFNYQCAGVAVCPFVRNECAAIYGDVVNNRAIMEWISGFNGVPQNFFFNFTYRVLQQ